MMAKERELVAVYRALANVGSDQASVYFDLLHHKPGDALLRAVEGLMIRGEPLSDWAKKHYREGLAEGTAKGKAEGKTEGKAEALLAILAARSLVPTREQRETIATCKDGDRLQRWIELALNTESVQKLLER
jgi:hypothetical protein